MKYRSEIDGLRALAVIPVVFFHAGFESFSGGFIGVDVFFVISGFLITTIIVSELELEQFKISTFYERRARRILPALFAVVFICFVCALFFLPPLEMITFSQSVLATLFFVSNIFFWREQNDYFAPASEDQILLHMWSLSIEEQFYFFFPILMIVLWRLNFKIRIPALIITAILSLIFNEWALRNEAISPSAVFYLLPTRAWELMCGSVCALSLKGRTLPSNEFLAFLGVAAIVTPMAIFDYSTPSPSLYLLIPVLGTCAILVYGRDTMVGKVLSFKPVVGIGLISFSLYLWHQPLFAFARVRLLNEPTPSIFLGLSVLSIFLASLTWRFIESPFRKRGNSVVYLGAPLALLAASASLLLVLSIGTIQQAGFPQRFVHFENWKNQHYELTQNSVSKECRFNQTIQLERLKSCLKSSGKHLILLGDSHADTLFAPFVSKLEDTEIGFAALISHSCFPIPGMKVKGPSDELGCNNFKRDVWNFIESRDDLHIVMSMRWSLYLNGERFDNLEGGVERGPRKHYIVDTPSASDDWQKSNSYDYVVDFLSEKAKKNQFLILTQYPEAGWDVKKWAAYSPRTLLEGLSTPFEAYIARNAGLDETLFLLREFGVEIIQLSDLLCDNYVEERCVIYWNDRAFYLDDNHPSPHAANIIVDVTLKTLELN